MVEYPYDLTLFIVFVTLFSSEGNIGYYIGLPVASSLGKDLDSNQNIR